MFNWNCYTVTFFHRGVWSSNGIAQICYHCGIRVVYTIKWLTWLGLSLLHAGYKAQISAISADGRSSIYPKGLIMYNMCLLQSQIPHSWMCLGIPCVPTWIKNNCTLKTKIAFLEFLSKKITVQICHCVTNAYILVRIICYKGAKYLQSHIIILPPPTLLQFNSCYSWRNTENALFIADLYSYIQSQSHDVSQHHIYSNKIRLKSMNILSYLNRI